MLWSVLPIVHEEALLVDNHPSKIANKHPRDAMEGFDKAEAAKFSVSLVAEDGRSERVTVAVGLDGLFMLSPDGRRALRKYPLNHISRWALRGTSLVLYTKTPVDVEERTVTLTSDDATIRDVLDTLTCSCMQCAPAPALCLSQVTC